MVKRSDVSDPDAIKALYDSVLAALDVLVNNAGIMRNLDLNKARDLIDVTREIEINLSGLVRMVQQFLPHLKTRPGSAIVNVSSGLAFVPFPTSPVYCATKAALHSFSQSLRAEICRLSSRPARRFRAQVDPGKRAHGGRVIQSFLGRRIRQFP